MLRNTEGLKRNAQSRSNAALQRATAAIRQMQAEEQVLSFRSVAAKAQVSTAWLYGNQPVREQILKLRQRSARVNCGSEPSRQQLSHERIVATLRLRVRNLEESNRELKQQLETAYGRLAVEPSASNRRTSFT
jgi:hypothetical protein